MISARLGIGPNTTAGGASAGPADSARWPVKGPAPLPGALLPDHRIIAFYGNPKSTRMGVLGELPPAEMLPKLERTPIPAGRRCRRSI